MKTFLIIILAIVFHDALALALVYIAKGFLWAASMIQTIAEII